MTNHEKNVLVFGATGGGGRAAALEASRRGAKVWLAMRDTTKAINGLSEGTDGSPGFVRVQADLSKPASVKEAVEQSGATSAFVYTMHDSPDDMRGTFQALKDAGITYVVLLSSFTVWGPARENLDGDYIKKVHAQAEVALDETGLRFAAIRPAFFNSNIFRERGLKEGEVQVYCPGVIRDYLAPEDIGAVSGALLANPQFPDDGSNAKVVYLCGPELMSQVEGFNVVSRTLGRDIKIKEIDEETYIANSKFLPEQVLQALLYYLREFPPPKSWYPEKLYDEGVGNIKKFADREPMRFADWVTAHKDEFQ